MNYAAIDKSTKVVVNNIEWNGDTYLDPNLTEEYNLIAWDNNTKGYPIDIGYTYDETYQGFISPKPTIKDISLVFNYDTWIWEESTPQ